MVLKRLRENAKSRLISIVGAGLIGLSGLIFPSVANGAGRLTLSNFTTDFSIGVKSVRFDENGSSASYLPYPFPPSLETYYEDANSNKYSRTGVNPSTNNYYNCPLAGQGTILDRTSNSIAFKILSEFPSNTLVTASMQTEGGYSNFCGDVIAFTKANSNSAGYAFIPLSDTKNASDRVYGNVLMKFTPTFPITTSNNVGGSISPSNTVYVPLGEGTNFMVTANEDYKISDIKTNGVSTGQGIGSNSYNYVWNNITNSGTINVDFSEKSTTNGIPFSWFRNYGYTNAITDSTETENFDTDTMNNLQEYIAGTDPTNALSCFAIGNMKKGNSFDIEIPNSLTNRTYHIDASSNLVNSVWQEDVTNSVGNGGTLIFEMSDALDNKKFYRARVGMN